MIRGADAAARRTDSGRRETAIWFGDLDRLPRRSELLSFDEVERSQRFRSQEHRNRYVSGRAWVRSVIGIELGVPPTDLRFGYVGLGKPVLDHPAGALDFSLAHSGAQALLAVGPPGGLGVDIERFAVGVYDPISAGSVLSAEELRWIDDAVDSDRAFLRCWVRKEAYAKVGGMGMHRSLAAVTLTGSESRGAARDIVIADLDIDAGLVAAIALPEGRPFTYRGSWLGEGAA